jgi:hypothetical protein
VEKNGRLGSIGDQPVRQICQHLVYSTHASECISLCYTIQMRTIIPGNLHYQSNASHVPDQLVVMERFAFSMPL